MARMSDYFRLACWVVAFVLFLLPIFNPPTPLDFFADQMTLLGVLALGLGARSWLQAVVAGVVFAMLATAIYALFGFGWFSAVIGEAINTPEKSWGSALVDIFVWTPALSAVMAYLGYLVRWIWVQTVGRLLAR